MKPEEKQQARKLRQEGISINTIAEKLHVSKASVSTWVKDITLTEEQFVKLRAQNPVINGQNKGAKTKADMARKQRLLYQEEGRLHARKYNPLHEAGCMLYWGEGAKNKNNCKLSNSDPYLLKFFLKFLYECYDIQIENIRIRVQCYLTNDLNLDQIENYWSTTLNIPRKNFSKSSVNSISLASKRRKSTNTLLYGTVSINVANTRLIQNIFGAIQEYGGFVDSKWLG